jgi:hypothetical protein
MMMITGSGWDDLGRWVTAVSLVAMLAYLAPGTMRLGPQWRQRCRIAAMVLIGAALVLAIAATIMWFAR